MEYPKIMGILCEIWIHKQLKVFVFIDSLEHHQ